MTSEEVMRLIRVDRFVKEACGVWDNPEAVKVILALARDLLVARAAVRRLLDGVREDLYEARECAVELTYGHCAKCQHDRALRLLAEKAMEGTDG